MAEAPRERNWRDLLHLAAYGLIVDLIFVLLFLIGGIEPAVLIFTVVVIGALLYSLRGSRAGDITLFVVVLLTLLANLPFTIPSLFDLESTVQFVLAVLFFVSAITGVVAGIQALRRAVPTPLIANWMWTALGVLVALSAVSVVVRLTSDQATAQPGDVKVTAEDVEFSPETLEADAGEVAVFVENKDLTGHTFTIDELDVDLTIAGGSKKRVTFTASAGTYEFHCTVAGHESMEGTLKIQ